MSDIGLADLIHKVKQELLIPEAPGNAIPFLSVDEVNLELQVTVTKEGEAGVKIWVINAGGNYGRENVQKITVKLTSLISKEERLKLLRRHDIPIFTSKS